jgi:hypothetical protein
MSSNLCPFCPLMLPCEPDLWETIGNDFYGSPATIGGIAACEDCAIVAGIYEPAIPDYIAQVTQRAEAAYQDMRARMLVYIHYVQAHLEVSHA